MRAPVYSHCPLTTSRFYDRLPDSYPAMQNARSLVHRQPGDQPRNRFSQQFDGQAAYISRQRAAWVLDRADVGFDARQGSGFFQ